MSEVARTEGNEGKGERRRGVGAPHCTGEAGEPTQGTPWREGGAGTRNRTEERWKGHRAHKPSQRNSNG
jgi:hypothetical protein